MPSRLPVVALALATSLALPLVTSADTKAPGPTQLDLNEKTKEDFKRADAELNRVYRQILKNNSTDKVFVEKMKTSRRAWIAFRDAELEALFPNEENPHFTYGFVFPMCWMQEKTALTIARTTRLKQWLEGAEGDVCAGSR